MMNRLSWYRHWHLSKKWIRLKHLISSLKTKIVPPDEFFTGGIVIIIFNF